jgi:broad specificity phosphatase PhoE
MEEIMSKIYLVRHGETEWNKEGRSQGCSNDIPLSSIGVKQAEAIGERLKDEAIDMFFSSSLARAYETASIIAKHHNKDVVTHKEFMEISFGVFEGLRFDEIKERYKEEYEIWRDTPHIHKVPGAESLNSLKERSLTLLMEIINCNSDKNILVVSHGITIKILIASILGIDFANLHTIKQDNTALSIFEYNEGKFYAQVINDTCHVNNI